MIEIPKQSAEVFEILSKGQFICSNSGRDLVRKLYNAINNDFDAYYMYFAGINLILEEGDEYYYFVRTDNRADLERKLDIAMKWIDIIDFLKTFDNGFGSGFRFRPSSILVRLSVDADLKNKLEGLKKYAGGKDKHAEIINKILDQLEKDNFIEVENEMTEEYKTLASFDYLEQLILNINIPEDIQNEIPE
ncbi:hypothetical protein AY601_4825 [Pedobacter cryoconitis]|uniref:Uncharacterized protein n=1 Tax=Pedobacter cryoconitis TaxID=188932 RepID=A0A127VJY3_9SPHI|nr:hypothetical protein [Pedobacter cryoconitis]AMQ01646.1 hypothetical protein AY601_4825 [Pedobacter cryoconitis]